MTKFYYIYFEVDNGYSYTRDVALVDADNAEEAVAKLRKFINAKDNETCISKIFKTERWNREIFTGKHSMR